MPMGRTPGSAAREGGRAGQRGAGLEAWEASGSTLCPRPARLVAPGACLRGRSVAQRLSRPRGCMKEAEDLGFGRRRGVRQARGRCGDTFRRRLPRCVGSLPQLGPERPGFCADGADLRNGVLKELGDFQQCGLSLSASGGLQQLLIQGCGRARDRRNSLLHVVSGQRLSSMIGRRRHEKPPAVSDASIITIGPCRMHSRVYPKRPLPAGQKLPGLQPVAETANEAMSPLCCHSTPR
jgi:hypothetical protein